MVDRGDSGREFPLWMKILSVVKPLLVAVIDYH